MISYVNSYFQMDPKSATFLPTHIKTKPETLYARLGAYLQEKI